jgi:uncharacterized protein (PEP-CTERM system associated)
MGTATALSVQVRASGIPIDAALCETNHVAGRVFWRGGPGGGIVLACLLSVSGLVEAERWEIVPSVGIRETYSDNINLAPKGQERPDWVTELSPGVSIRGTGARLRVNADYAYVMRWYKNESQGDDTNHILNANANADLWNRQLLLDANASITQQDVSPFQPVTGSNNTNLTDNRTEVRRIVISPYWLGRLGTWADLEARYTWDQVQSSGTTDQLDSTLSGYHLNLKSGPQFGNLGWSLRYLKQHIDYTQTGSRIQDTSLENLTATLRYLIYPTLTAVGSVGYDDNNYVTAPGQENSGPFWNAGLEWAPSQRTHVGGTFGHRYDGDTKSFNFRHRTRLTVWTVTYTDQIVNSPQRQELSTSANTRLVLDRLLTAQIPDPIARQTAVQSFITQSGLPPTLNSSLEFWTNQVYRSELWTGSVGYLGVRSSLIITIFSDDRTRLSAAATALPGIDPFTLDNNYVQKGGGIVGSWRLSERAVASMGLGTSQISYKTTAREDTDTYIRAGMTYQVQRKVTAAVNIGRVERDSNVPNSSYEENSIVGSLRVAF